MTMKPGRCCGTTRTWFGKIMEEPRGNPPRFKRGRKVFHVRAHVDRDEIFWHWFDQKGKLTDPYSYGPNLQPCHGRTGWNQEQ